jgi:hypothetical protein
MNFTLAYTAGYTDGDGCFTITINGKRKFKSSYIVSSVNKNVLDFLVELFEGKVRFVRKLIKEKPQYHFVKTGKSASHLSKQIIPYLVEKKEEAEIFNRFHECFDFQEKIQFMNRLKEARSKGRAKISDKIELESIRNSIEPTEEDFAYFAGFIDAECSLGLQRYKAKGNSNWIYKPIFQCNNTRSQTLKWGVARFGGQIHFIDRSKYGKNHLNQLTWRISSKSLLKIIPKILPFIKHKKTVCDELMKFAEATLKTSRNHRNFVDLYHPILKLRATIFHNIHNLNRKGSTI